MLPLAVSYRVAQKAAPLVADADQPSLLNHVQPCALLPPYKSGSAPQTAAGSQAAPTLGTGACCEAGRAAAVVIIAIIVRAPKQSPMAPKCRKYAGTPLFVHILRLYV